MTKQDLEDALFEEIMSSYDPKDEPEREYRFHEERKWRLDFAWPEKMVAIELEGGAWTQGRHTRGKGFLNDCEKYNTATSMGWRILRIPTDWVGTGAVFSWLDKMVLPMV